MNILNILQHFKVSDQRKSFLCEPTTHQLVAALLLLLM